MIIKLCLWETLCTGGRFCTVTGQDDWCLDDAPYLEDESEDCQVEQWCVCEWAFASYIKSAGGCNHVQDIVCDSVNKLAIQHYEEKAADNAEVQAALDSLVEKCDLSLE